MSENLLNDKERMYVPLPVNRIMVEVTSMYFTEEGEMKVEFEIDKNTKTSLGTEWAKGVEKELMGILLNALEREAESKEE